MKLVSKVVDYRSPGPGTTAYQVACYTRPSGLEKMRLRYLELRDDIYDCGVRFFSPDNGRTWPESRPCVMSEKRPDGMLRRMEDAGFIDPVNGRLLNIILEGVLPNDTPLDGMRSWYLKYRVSEDGGRTALVEDLVMQDGGTPEHPLDCVWVGRNAVMKGVESSIVRALQGHLVLAAMLTPLGPDGQYYNPGGGYTWTEVLIIIGEWQRDGRIAWRPGPRVAIAPSRSTRGVVEPTLALMPNGRILMVMRGSNDVKPELPAYKWFSVSCDGGLTWTEPAPWRYSDGSPFFSPSSMSQLMWHSNGRCYWVGNISKSNPCGNSPRYPLVIGAVDLESLMLVKESVAVIDDRGPGDPPSLSLSNFVVHEDRETGEIVIYMTRFHLNEANLYCGDGYIYRVAP
jgi:hypothetical protein